MKHAKEKGTRVPSEPIVFSKFSNSLAGHMEDISTPVMSKQIDYEGKLEILFGKKAVNVLEGEALEYVYEYFIANYVLERDLQSISGQWLLGKTCDKFAPVGPYVVTLGEISNLNNLNIRTFVNDELRQGSNTSDTVFYFNSLISYISRCFSLEPGDIILTGTVEGVIVGMPEEHKVWLKDGDVVRVEIDNLGTHENKYRGPIPHC